MKAMLRWWSVVSSAQLETAISQLKAAISENHRDHPHTLACAANVVAVLAALNREREADELGSDTHDRYSNTIGVDHPDARLFAEGKRFGLDFWPLPL